MHPSQNASEPNEGDAYSAVDEAIPRGVRSMRIPYVIDNQTHRLSYILSALLAEHRGRSLDVATAYFTVRGFELLKDGLLGLGNFRLLLGAEPTSGEQIGLRPNVAQVKGLLRRDLKALPFDEGTAGRKQKNVPGLSKGLLRRPIVSSIGLERIGRSTSSSPPTFSPKARISRTADIW
jgi:hypothetical protein